MTEHRVRTLYESQTIRIEDYRCNGTLAEKSGEESSPEHLVVLLRAGTFVRHDPSGTLAADVNQVLFFHRDEPYQISHPVPGGDRCTVFAMPQPTLMDLLRSFDPTVDDRPRRPFPVNHSLADTRELMLQHQLLQTVSGVGSADPLQLEEQVLVLLSGVVRRAHAAMGGVTAHRRGDTAAADRARVNHVRLVLGERYRERLRLEEIARAVDSSPYHICRIFRRETGVSIHRYLQRMRLAGALEQLAEQPDEGLTDLALALGFSSHSHFSTAFRREFMLTPSGYRSTVTGRRLREMHRILKA